MRWHIYTARLIIGWLDSPNWMGELYVVIKFIINANE